MKISSCLMNMLLTLLCFLVFAIPLATSDSIDDNFVKCISLQNTSTPTPIYSPNDTSYTAIFTSAARNLRYLTPTSQKPRFVIAPTDESHVQAAVVCSRRVGLDFKVRSGGHDSEGQSYSSDNPFVFVDFVNFRNVTVNVEYQTAWIQAGAQLGDVYYRIGEKTRTLGFPAGFTPTVGVGGHISGGGMGALIRKYGLSSDQVIDARIVNANGTILNRETMGRDLFWAIRGGGAASFGVVLSWKVSLVPVTPNVTASIIDRTLEQNATNLVYKWQTIADKLPRDLFISLTIFPANSSQTNQRTVQVQFWILFLGSADNLLQLMAQRYPELGLERTDCVEMSWVESHIFFYRRGSPLELLLDRDPQTKFFSKVKNDYVQVPITKRALEGIWRKFLEIDGFPIMFWHPLGGRMNEISQFETPYPHRIGNIFNLLYNLNWQEATDSERNIDWMRRFYDYMAPYVSKFPRAAYFNYRDFDLGQNDDDFKYLTARRWGTKYFRSNFERLVSTKTKVDPSNFFKNKQSIPPF